MSANFGIIVRPNSVAEAVGEARNAQAVGFDTLGFVDSQSVYRELYVTMAACAEATDRIRLMPAVSNPVTRHPASSASAIASIADLAPARTAFGIGSGDSAVLNLGERPARIAELHEYVVAVRSMLSQGSAMYRGHRISMSWTPTSRIPIYLSAEGPKTLQLAGEIADGVIINPGLRADLIGAALDEIRTGADRAGRDPEDVDVVLIARVNVCADRAAGIREIAMELASSAHHVFRFTTAGKGLPDDLRDAVRRVQDAYVPAEHERTGGVNARAIQDEPELLDYLAERFAVVGTPADCVRQLTDIVTTSGVRSVLFTGFVHDRRSLIDVLGRTVLPAVRAQTRLSAP